MRLILCFSFIFMGVPQNALAEDITEANLREHIEILANDKFTGRKPGTEGENKTVNYIATKWSEAGVLPAVGDSWYQEIILSDQKPTASTLEFSQLGAETGKELAIDSDQFILRSDSEQVKLLDIPVVHVGYGLGKSEKLRRHVAGKIAIIYYDRPTEKPDASRYSLRREKVMDAGAAGVIAVVSSKNQWTRFERRFQRSRTGLYERSGTDQFEGVIRAKAMNRILRRMDIDAVDLKMRAFHDDFMPVDLDATASLSVDMSVRTYPSHNVVGKIPGSDPAAGSILFMGHWDGFGECRSEGAADRICNGAVDNASGIALLIETAERLAREQHARDIYFLATTAEESGLLGAKAFLKKPVMKLDGLQVVFNADTNALSDNGDLIAVIGLGETELDADIKNVAKALGRTIDRSGTSDAYLERQDGYVFLEKGIPAFLISSAFADEERLNAYLGDRYHSVSDEADENLLLQGAAADANFHVALGRYFASTATYPAKETGE